MKNLARVHIDVMNRNAALFAVMCVVWGLTWWPVKVGAAHVPPIFLAAARFLLAGR
jgi:hypothetical protein